MPDTTTDWIKPGAAVVLYDTAARRDSRDVVQTTIKRVAGKSFTVDDRRGEIRFPIDRLRVRQGGGMLASSWTRHVVPAGSDTAREVLAEAAMQRAENAARNAVDAWERDRSRENRHAAIAALQALDEHDPESNGDPR